MENRTCSLIEFKSGSQEFSVSFIASSCCSSHFGLILFSCCYYFFFLILLLLLFSSLVHVVVRFTWDCYSSPIAIILFFSGPGFQDLDARVGPGRRETRFFSYYYYYFSLGWFLLLFFSLGTATLLLLLLLFFSQDLGFKTSTRASGLVSVKPDFSHTAIIIFLVVGSSCCSSHLGLLLFSYCYYFFFFRTSTRTLSPVDMKLELRQGHVRPSRSQQRRPKHHRQT